jgi:REP element-mobilizing transposase RayT
MARKPRLEVEGVHHVYARGNDRQRIFRDDLDRESYLATLAVVVVRKKWSCLAYCLMANHVHLLVETREPNLGRGMGLLHGLYGRAFNDRHGRTGHVFEGRYGAVRQTTDEQLWHTIAYIARNPVTAGMCAGPKMWRWSSHSAVLSGAGPRWLDAAGLLRRFENLGGDPRRRYAELVG